MGNTFESGVSNGQISKKKILVFLTLLFFCFVFLMFFSTLSYSLYIFFFENIITKEKTVFNYQYLRVNSEINETSIGTTPSLIKLGGDEFISYRTHDGGHVLISNFGTQEYKCFGTCFCDSKKRRYSQLLSGRVFYLVAAISSLVAYNKAKELMKLECEEKMEEEELGCTGDDLKAIVEECVKILEDALEEIENDDGRTPDEEYWYRCEGNCMTTPRVYNSKMLNKRKKEVKCENSKLKAKFKLEDRSVWSYQSPLRMAKCHFREKYMKKFCKKKGKIVNPKFKKANKKIYLCLSLEAPVRCKRLNDEGLLKDDSLDQRLESE